MSLSESEESSSEPALIGTQKLSHLFEGAGDVTNRNQRLVEKSLAMQLISLSLPVEHDAIRLFSEPTANKFRTCLAQK